MKRLSYLVALALAVLAVGATSAVASSCANLSRPAPNDVVAGQPLTRGNWVWLPSIGVPAPFWGFAPPGSEDAQLLGLPGAGGNHAGASLLDMSAICRKGIPTGRQTEHGVQTGCE